MSCECGGTCGGCGGENVTLDTTQVLELSDTGSVERVSQLTARIQTLELAILALGRQATFSK